MAFQIAIIIAIPIILGVVTVTPFDEPRAVEEPVEIDKESNFDMLYFFLIIIWFIFLIRILFQMKRGTFSLQRRY